METEESNFNDNSNIHENTKHTDPILIRLEESYQNKKKYITEDECKLWNMEKYDLDKLDVRLKICGVLLLRCYNGFLNVENEIQKDNFNGTMNFFNLMRENLFIGFYKKDYMLYRHIE